MLPMPGLSGISGSRERMKLFRSLSPVESGSPEVRKKSASSFAETIPAP